MGREPCGLNRGMDTGDLQTREFYAFSRLEGRASAHITNQLFGREVLRNEGVRRGGKGNKWRRAISVLPLSPLLVEELNRSGLREEEINDELHEQVPTARNNLKLKIGNLGVFHGKRGSTHLAIVPDSAGIDQLREEREQTIRIFADITGSPAFLEMLEKMDDRIPHLGQVRFDADTEGGAKSVQTRAYGVLKHLGSNIQVSVDPLKIA